MFRLMHLNQGPASSIPSNKEEGHSRDRVNSQSRAPSASFPLKPSPTKNVSLLSTREL